MRVFLMSVLVSFFCMNVGAAPDPTPNGGPEYYWQIGVATPSDNKESSTTFVLGKRELFPGEQKEIDTQVYVSADEGPIEYAYHFNFKNKSLDVFLGGKKVGTGKVDCKGPSLKPTECSYEYAVTEGPSQYKSKAKDSYIRKGGVLYRETSEMVLKSEPDKKYNWKAEYLQIDEATYKKMKGLVLKN
jgi:hypothetical protein